MHVNNLPSDVLSLILKQTVGMQSQCMQNWKSSIELLAVCRHWRVLAQPWVHYFAFIECYDSPDEEISISSNIESSTLNFAVGATDTSSNSEDSSDDDSSVYDENQGSVLNQQAPIWMTNVDFHTLCGCEHKVKKLEIYLDAPIHLLYYLQGVQIRLNPEESQWSGVKYLAINIFSVVPELDELNDDEGNQIAEVKHIAALLNHCMCNVQKVNIDSHMSHHGSIVSKAFFSTVFNLYSGQLEVMRSNVPTKLTVTTLSTKLSYLKIIVDPEVKSLDTHIPTFFLHTMLLVDLPKQFSWSIFKDKQAAGQINMPNLEMLYMSFNPSHNLLESSNRQAEALESQSKRYTKDKTIISIPKLHTLRLEFTPPSSFIFNTDTTPRNFKELGISGSFLLIKKASNINMLSAHLMFIYLDSITAADEQAFYTVTNKLFGQIKINNICEFVARARFPFAIDPERTRWTNLTSLNFFCAVDFSVFLKIICRTPSLKELVFRNVFFDAFMERVGFVGSPYWQKLLKAPLNNTVSKMGVMGKYRQYSTHLISNIIYFMIQRLPALVDVYLRADKLIEHTNTLLRSPLNRHPHIRQVVIGSDGF
ncbi:hypothetical protein BX070DRAFT_237561 [Coemansia spiralis]|nr:hypothetical protein BX070DRAFT_237561 [Coemansia spiralis]